jgi:hypothetical protein
MLDINIKTSKQFILYKLCFTVEQPPIHETAGLFPVKIEKKKSCCTFVNFLTKFKTKNCCKTAKYILSKWKTITSTEFVLAHAHNVENRPWHKQNWDSFALRYVFTYPGIISRAELVPSHGASRRRLGD